MGLWQWMTGGTPPEPRVHAAPVHIAPGRGYTFEIVGESNFQDALDDLCGGKCEDGHDLDQTAQLCFLEDNPHDPNAIGVLIQGNAVGYVPRHVAAHLRSEILRINPDRRPVTCDARVVGGWDRGDGDEGHYGVKLSLSQPLRAAVS